MKQHNSLLACSLVVGALAAGRAEAAPEWCSAPGVKDVSVSSVSELYRETQGYEALHTLVAATCNPDREARAQARQIEATRQAWSAKLHLTEADWRDVAAWATQGRELRRDGQLQRADDKLALSAYSPIDQYEVLTRATDPAYLADAFGARLSLAGRMGYIRRCVEGKPLEWAMCQADVDAFDAGKLSAELRGDTAHDGFHRTRLRLEAHQLAGKLVEHAAQVKAVVAKDAGYRQLFELAVVARKGWGEVTPALVELMRTMDDARVTNSRKASEGCGEPTWQAFGDVVGRIPAKQFTGIEPTITEPFLAQAMAKVISTPDGYLASLALLECAVLNRKHDYLTRVLGSVLASWPGFRGPRTATHTAVLSAGVTLDDRDAKLEMPRVDRDWLEAGPLSSGGGGTGTILGLEPSGDVVTLTFAKIKGTQQKCVRGRTTNRITQIRSDGTLVYEYVCLEERTETYAEPPAPPQKIAARYARGLKPGMFVTTIESVVTAAYAKGAKRPSFVAGVAVK
jgi:hypothetical protein